MKSKKFHKNDRLHIEYTVRENALKSLGFATYEDYLISGLYTGIRKHFFAINKVCFVCGGKPDQIHHQSYKVKVLTGIESKYLYAICRVCHTECEYEGGNKLSPSQATVRMKMLKDLYECKETPAVKRELQRRIKLKEKRKRQFLGKIQREENERKLKEKNELIELKWKLFVESRSQKTNKFQQ